MESIVLKRKIIEEYWTKKLAEGLTKVSLPTYDFLREKKDLYKDSTKARISKETSCKIHKICKGHDIGVFILMMTNLKVLLYKYCKVDDIVIATTSKKASENNQLQICRSQIKSEISLMEFNEVVKKNVLDMFSYNDKYSFDEVYRKLLKSKKVNLFDILNIGFVFENIQTKVPELDNLDIIISLSYDKGIFNLDVEYKTDMYLENIVVNFISSYLYLLDNIDENLVKSIEAIDIVGEKERKTQLVDFNQNKIDFPEKDISLHQMFEKQACKTPNDTAVCFNEKSITYKCLNEKSNQLARLLIEKGIKKGAVVGILTEISIETIIAIIAVIKSGGVYLPLDPELNQERFRNIAANSQFKLLLSNGIKADLNFFEGEVIDVCNSSIYMGDPGNLDIHIACGELAYIIYTSGTTGVPKGVMVEHKSIVNQFLGLLHLYKFDSSLNHVLMAPFTFDPSIQQVFLPLITGAQLFLISKETKTQPSAFWSFITENKINIINTVPSIMEVLLDYNYKVTQDFRFIILAGEAFTRDLLVRLKDKLSIEKIINIYGPTEAAINTTLYEINAEEAGKVVPIGKPLINYNILILDENRRLVPIGTIGELYISGIGLACGYINDKKLTDEKFVPNTLIPLDERMYKTGDLCRFYPDGNIEFIGRVDQQVKIRGMRVELREIESILLEIEWIKEIAVIYDPNKGLYAFYTSKTGSKAGSSNSSYHEELIREYLKKNLPAYMIPNRILRIDSMPVNENGKTDKSTLFKMLDTLLSSRENKAPRNDIEKKLVNIWKEVLKTEKVSIDDSFFELGGNSLSIVKLREKVNNALEANISVAQLFSYHTISMLSEYLKNSDNDTGDKSLEEREKHKKNTLNKCEDIAVIGMACRFPLANDVDEFWSKLSCGYDAVREIPGQRMEDLAKIFNNGLNSQKYPIAAYLERIDQFDAGFFNITPNEARFMDPHQRIFLEVAYEALECAGYPGNCIHGSKTGVYVGASRSRYQDGIEIIEPSALAGNLYPVIAGRIAYSFDLKGPSQMIDTACSSSLVAVHHACNGIKSGDCDIAIAGGINLYLTPLDENVFEVGIASADGKSKTFDSSANGTGGGEGAGAVILKSFDKAVADGDFIYAVIKGSSVNSDGKSNGITAPNAAAQAEAIKSAWINGNVNPETVTYIEAHGTGTKIGDPIEIEGITNAFRSFTDKKQFCAVGSVKTNIGHLDSASGIAGFIKTVLALGNKQIPESLHFKNPNSHIDFINSPVFVNKKLSKWERGQDLRRAGVSSFGLSGTNCHVVLEEYPENRIINDGGNNREYIFTLSAKSINSFSKLINKYDDFLKNAMWSFENICYTSNNGRVHYSFRLAIIASNLHELKRKLNYFIINWEETKLKVEFTREKIYFSSVKPNIESELVNVLGMPLEIIAKEYVKGSKIDWKLCYKKESRKKVPLPLYTFDHKRYWVEPVKQKSADVKKGVIMPDVKVKDLVKSVFDLGEGVLGKIDFDFASGFKETIEEFSSCLIIDMLNEFNVLEDGKQVYTIEELEQRTGIIAQYKKLFRYMIEHLKKNGFVVEENGKIMLPVNYIIRNSNEIHRSAKEKFPEFIGSFNVLKYCFEFYGKVLTGELSPLSVLFPDGTPDFLQTFTNKGQTLGDLNEYLGIQSVKNYIKAFNGRKLKILEVGAGSGTIAKQIFEDIEDCEVEYYFTDIGRSIVSQARNMFSKYNFVKYKVFDIESDPATQGYSENEFDIIIALNVVHATRSIGTSLSNLKKVLSRDGVMFIIEKVVNEPSENLVWGLTDGWWLFEDSHIREQSPLVDISTWEKIFSEHGFSVYTFPQGERKQQLTETALFVLKNSINSEQEYKSYLYMVDWKEKSIKESKIDTSQGMWLVLCDKTGVGEEVIKKLELSGQKCIKVEYGECFKKIDENCYILNPGIADDYNTFLENLGEKINLLMGIIHLWSYTEDIKYINSVEHVYESQITGSFSMFFLTKALIKYNISQMLDIRIVSNFACHIGDKHICPERAPVFGLGKVISQEYSNMKCYLIDIDNLRYNAKVAASIILTEIGANKTDYTVAYREERYINELKRFYPASPQIRDAIIKDNNVYIVVGGTGGLGIEICKFLASKARIKLIIVNRTPLPHKKDWDNAIIDGSLTEELRRKIKAFRQMEASGTEVLYYSADVTVYEQMKTVIDDVKNRLGKINGVINCAAAPGSLSRVLEKQSFENFKKVLSPKIKGTLILDMITNNEKLDFFVLFSSVASLWGGASGGDYAAANSFLDAYSCYMNSIGKPMLSINWYAWEGLTGPGCMGYMPVSYAVKAFEESLTCGLNQIVIGKFNLNTLAEWAPMFKISLSDDIFENKESWSAPVKTDDILILHNGNSMDVVLSGKSNDYEYTKMERVIGSIWAEVLGYDEIDINSNFFGIGGDSLSILKVLKLVNERIKHEIEVSDLFTYTTIAKLAEFIGKRESKSNRDDALMDLIKCVKDKKITVEDAMKGYEKNEG